MTVVQQLSKLDFTAMSSGVRSAFIIRMKKPPSVIDKVLLQCVESNEELTLPISDVQTDGLMKNYYCLSFGLANPYATAPTLERQ